jgi:hypothetical protein
MNKKRLALLLLGAAAILIWQYPEALAVAFWGSFWGSFVIIVLFPILAWLLPIVLAIWFLMTRWHNIFGSKTERSQK